MKRIAVHRATLYERKRKLSWCTRNSLCSFFVHCSHVVSIFLFSLWCYATAGNHLLRYQKWPTSSLPSELPDGHYWLSLSLTTDYCFLFYVANRIFCYLDTYITLLRIPLGVLPQVTMFCSDLGSYCRSEARGLLQSELGGTSDKEVNGLSYVYTAWYAYLQIETIQSGTDSYCTNVGYCRVSCSTISSSDKVNILQ